MMAAALLPLRPPERSSALQPHTSSASRAILSADKIKKINENIKKPKFTSLKLNVYVLVEH